MFTGKVSHVNECYRPQCVLATERILPQTELGKGVIP